MSEENHLDELNTTGRKISVSKNYTYFVKFMRLLLPLSALALIMIVLAWPDMEDKIIIVQKEDIIPNSNSNIGENELLNPRFETTDAQQQPVHVTAIRALQNQENLNLVTLDSPSADLKMKDGAAVHIEADKGTYEQEVEKLFLQQNVKIHHESGYELQAEELRVNMKTREAFSDKNVHIQGPDVQIDATGLEGNVEEGILIFKGPAKLTLTPKDKTEIELEQVEELPNE